MENVQIDTTSAEGETTWTRLPDFAANLSLSSSEPLTVNRLRLQRLLPQLVGSLFLIAATTSAVVYTEPVTSLFDGSASLGFRPVSATRRRITSLNMAWTQAGKVAVDAIARRQKQRELEAREFFASIESE